MVENFVYYLSWLVLSYLWLFWVYWPISGKAVQASSTLHYWQSCRLVSFPGTTLFTNVQCGYFDWFCILSTRLLFRLNLKLVQRFQLIFNGLSNSQLSLNIQWWTSFLVKGHADMNCCFTEYKLQLGCCQNITEKFLRDVHLLPSAVFLLQAFKPYSE